MTKIFLCTLSFLVILLCISGCLKSCPENQKCNGVCYDPAMNYCSNNIVCPFQYSGCGEHCYKIASEGCCNGTIYNWTTQFCEGGIIKNPVNAKDWTQMAYELGVTDLIGNKTLALEQVDTAVQIDPNYDAAWLVKGAILYRMERYDEAIIALDRIIALGNIQPCDMSIPGNQVGTKICISFNFNYRTSMLIKAEALKKLGRSQEAERIYDRLLEIYNDDNEIKNARTTGQFTWAFSL